MKVSVQRGVNETKCYKRGLEETEEMSHELNSSRKHEEDLTVPDCIGVKVSEYGSRHHSPVGLDSREAQNQKKSKAKHKIRRKRGVEGHSKR